MPQTKEQFETVYGNRLSTIFKELGITQYSTHLSRIIDAESEFWYHDDFTLNLLTGILLPKDHVTIDEWDKYFWDWRSTEKYKDNLNNRLNPSFDEFVADLHDMGICVYYCNTIPKQHQTDGIQAVLPKRPKTQVYDEKQFRKLQALKPNSSSQKRRF